VSLAIRTTTRKHNMETYTKLSSNLITSSVWAEKSETKVLWITLLSLADQHGEVFGSPVGLARLAGITIDECEASLIMLTSPDRHSRSPDMDGRRLEEIEGGWSLVNHAKYRDLASREDVKRKQNLRQKRYVIRKNEKQNADGKTSFTDEKTSSCDGKTSVADGETSFVTHGPYKQKQKQIQKKKREEDKLPHSERFATAWDEWRMHRREKKLGLTKTSSGKQLVMLSLMSESDAIAVIDQSITNGWTGLFPVKKQGYQPKTQSADQFRI
jgi:hypothetical protein